jgi:hypothetical protein
MAYTVLITFQVIDHTILSPPADNKFTEMHESFQIVHQTKENVLNSYNRISTVVSDIKYQLSI